MRLEAVRREAAEQLAEAREGAARQLAGAQGAATKLLARLKTAALHEVQRAEAFLEGKVGAGAGGPGVRQRMQAEREHTYVLLSVRFPYLAWKPHPCRSHVAMARTIRKVLLTSTCTFSRYA